MSCGQISLSLVSRSPPLHHLKSGYRSMTWFVSFGTRPVLFTAWCSSLYCVESLCIYCQCSLWERICALHVCVKCRLMPCRLTIMELSIAFWVRCSLSTACSVLHWYWIEYPDSTQNAVLWKYYILGTVWVLHSGYFSSTTLHSGYSSTALWIRYFRSTAFWVLHSGYFRSTAFWLGYYLSIAFWVLSELHSGYSVLKIRLWRNHFCTGSLFILFLIRSSFLFN